jgi:hypothetical protein
LIPCKSAAPPSKVTKATLVGTAPPGSGESRGPVLDLGPISKLRAQFRLSSPPKLSCPGVGRGPI